MSYFFNQNPPNKFQMKLKDNIVTYKMLYVQEN